MSRTVTLKGNPLTLEGPELHTGDSAPDARLRKNLVNDASLSEWSGKVRVYSVVPSLDTPVCADQTRRFNKEAAQLSGVEIFTISCDLPTAQGRFCGTENLTGDTFHTLSDHKYTDFGSRYGTLIPDLRILCRAVFVVDTDDALRYVEYVPEIADHPDYDAILESVKSLA